CALSASSFFTSPRVRGEVASTLRAGEGEFQAGPDSRMLPLTRRLCCAPSPTSPGKRGEVAFHAVIASGAKQSMARHCQIEDGLLRSARNDGKILLRDLKHTSAISPQAREFCR